MSLFARSLLVLAFLFAMVFAVGTGVLYYLHMPLIYAVVFAVGVVTLQFALGPYIIDWIYRINWYQPAQISPDFEAFLVELCKKRRIPVPRFGIIDDGNPNAFTYGHVPGNARLVVTRGLMEMLSKEECEAVVAHELGHITHYDFVIMTLASLAPAILYILYRWSLRNRRGGAYMLAVAVGAFICYYISQYIVLFLSRIREYWADEHASVSMGNPNAIATALVKIGYGLARIQDPAQQAAAQNKKRQPLFNRSQMMGSLGICSFSSATPMALYSTTAAGEFSMDHMLRAMQWDLWNPWARWFELHSTHPLIARRVRATSRVSAKLGMNPAFPMTDPKAIPWRAFGTDLMFLSLPWIGVVFGILFGFGREIHNPGAVIAGADAVSRWALVPLLGGIGWIIRLGYSYGKEFRRSAVVDLVGEMEVSHINCIPTELTGQVIGRGVPGLFWSKDLVLQDESGFITLIYRQPLSILGTLFGLFKADQLVGKTGTIKGWYRRGPSPYVELSSATFENGDSIKCYYPASLWFFAVLTTIIGALMFFARI